jgi:hypothetical protein
MIGFLALGGAFGWLLGNAIVADKVVIAALARNQVKYTPHPPTKMLKVSTVVWIDPGWRVVGATDTHLILSMGERPWEVE